MASGSKHGLMIVAASLSLQALSSIAIIPRVPHNIYRPRFLYEYVQNMLCICHNDTWGVVYIDRPYRMRCILNHAPCTGIHAHY